MVNFTVGDLAAAGALSVALFASLLLLAVLSRAREDLLISKLGWRLVATAIGLLALRALELVIQTDWMAILAPIGGIAAAILLPMGLYLVLRTARQMEVDAAEPSR